MIVIGKSFVLNMPKMLITSARSVIGGVMWLHWMSLTT